MHNAALRFPPHHASSPARLLAAAALACAALATGPLAAQTSPASSPASNPAVSTAPPAAGAIRPVLTVALIKPQSSTLARQLAANGSIAAWQEAVIGAETGGLRISALHAAIGDTVKRGQLLAQLSSEAVEADVAQARAALAEAEVALADARANAERARQVRGTGALSEQQIAQMLTAENAAAARVQALRAQLSAQQLRLRNTRITASDDGVISARSALLGAVVQPGQELFRLVRHHRLEWRAEVTASELGKIRPGMPVSVTAVGAGNATGKVRVVAPTIDPLTRTALVYVDLPDAMRHGLRAGMFARGELQVGSNVALVVSQESVLMRDGFSYVFRVGPVDKQQARITQVKVQTGRRNGNQVEVVSGIKADDAIVASGVSFLADGDTVRVVKP